MGRLTLVDLLVPLQEGLLVLELVGLLESALVHLLVPVLLEDLSVLVLENLLVPTLKDLLVPVLEDLLALVMDFLSVLELGTRIHIMREDLTGPKLVHIVRQLIFLPHPLDLQVHPYLRQEFADKWLMEKEKREVVSLSSPH